MTWSSSFLETGKLSPVSIDSSTYEFPRLTLPSTGILSPGRTKSISPASISSAAISCSPFSAVANCTRTLFIVPDSTKCSGRNWCSFDHRRWPYGEATFQPLNPERNSMIDFSRIESVIDVAKMHAAHVAVVGCGAASRGPLPRSRDRSAWPGLGAPGFQPVGSYAGGPEGVWAGSSLSEQDRMART